MAEVTLKDVLSAIEGQKKAIDDQFTSYGQKLTGYDEAMAQLVERIKFLETEFKSPNRISLPGVDEQKQKFSFFKAINAIASKDWSDAQFELEVFKETRKKATDMAASSGTGQFIVPEQYVAQIIELLRSKLVTLTLGVQIMDGLTSAPIDIPKMTGGSTGYWVNENNEITQSNLTFGQITMSPRQVGAIVVLSNRLLRMSNPSAETIVRNDMAACLAHSVDYAVLRGSGVAGQPLGIANTPGINTNEFGTNGAVPTWDNFFDMEYELDADNALDGSLGYCFHPAIRRVLVKTKIPQYSEDTGGAYMVQPVTNAKIQDWLGYPFVTTTQIPIDLTYGTTGTDCTEIYFGNWSECIVGQWGGLELMASDVAGGSFEKVQTMVRIVQEVDVAIRHAESFCLSNSAKIK